MGSGARLDHTSKTPSQASVHDLGAIVKSDADKHPYRNLEIFNGSERQSMNIREQQSSLIHSFDYEKQRVVGDTINFEEERDHVPAHTYGISNQLSRPTTHSNQRRYIPRQMEQI